MGKRSKNSKKMPEWEKGDGDDSASCASTGTMLSSLALGEDDEDFYEDDPLQQGLDDLFEKRGGTREKAYKTINSAFEASVRIEDCMRNEATIFSRCLNSIRKGGAAEAALAARCMGLHILILGTEAERSVGDAVADLTKAADHGKSVEVKVAAVEALAIAAFVTVDEQEETEEILASLRVCWKQDSSKVKAAALRGWAFLVSSLGKPLLSSSKVESAMEQLAGLLHDGHVDVRKAAGEAIALVHHSSGLGDVDEEDEDDYFEEEEAAAEAAGAGAGGVGRGEGPGGADAMSECASTQSGMEDVMDRMQDLSKNRGDRQRKSKRERAALRSVFRDLCSVMQDGEVKAQKVKLQHGDCLVVDTMAGIVQLNYLRSFLAGGFHAHLQGNPLLHSVFAFTPLAERGERLTGAEKRAFRSPSSFASKSRAQDRKAQRNYKSAVAAW